MKFSMTVTGAEGKVLKHQTAIVSANQLKRMRAPEFDNEVRSKLWKHGKVTVHLLGDVKIEYALEK